RGTELTAALGLIQLRKLQANNDQRRALGGRVLEERWSGDMMGMEFMGHGRTGFNNVTGEYWSTWTDNMSTGLMMFTGSFNESSNRFEFSSSYIDPVTKETVYSRSVATPEENGQETMEMYETRDGEEFMTMRMTLTRN
ncbi:MAG: DUF1579 family protein, partial [Pseudomonadota bacterium]